MQDRVTKWVLPVDENDQGELIVTLPNDLLEVMGVKGGDTIVWKDNADGTLSIDKEHG